MLLHIAQRIGLPFLLLVLGGIYFLEVSQGRAQDMLLIRPVFYCMLVLFCINAATDLRAILKANTKGESRESGDTSLRKILPFAVLAIGFVAALPFLGFIFSSLVYLVLILRVFKVEEKKVLIVLPLVVSISLYLLFVYVFGVELPVSFLGI